MAPHSPPPFFVTLVFFPIKKSKPPQATTTHSSIPKSHICRNKPFFVVVIASPLASKFHPQQYATVAQHTSSSSLAIPSSEPTPSERRPFHAIPSSAEYRGVVFVRVISSVVDIGVRWRWAREGGLVLTVRSPVTSHRQDADQRAYWHKKFETVSGAQDKGVGIFEEDHWGESAGMLLNFFLFEFRSADCVVEVGQTAGCFFLCHVKLNVN